MILNKWILRDVTLVKRGMVESKTEVVVWKVVRDDACLAISR